jgi:hypothetical protein
LGHNNDTACLNSTVLPDGNGNLQQFWEWMDEQKHGVWLADSGYFAKNSQQILIPNSSPFANNIHDAELDWSWRDEHHSQRAIVENVFGRVENWKSCTMPFDGTPEMQGICIIVVFWLVNEDRKDRPFRAAMF